MGKFGNTGMGINNAFFVWPTVNDDGDGDGGPNNTQNYPMLTSVASGSTVIEGSLNSTANTTFRLEFFSNGVCDRLGYGEGETYLGFTNVTTDGTGNVSFTVNFPDTVPAGSYITATATDPGNNTSEFSACQAVVAEPTPTPAPGLTDWGLMGMEGLIVITLSWRLRRVSGQSGNRAEN